MRLSVTDFHSQRHVALLPLPLRLPELLLRVRLHVAPLHGDVVAGVRAGVLVARTQGVKELVGRDTEVLGTLRLVSFPSNLFHF